jgi:hypothetical protein
MTTEQGQARLASALWESDRHRAALSEALADWAGLRAPDAHALENDPVLRRLTDQILYRFMKLQDALGERLVPATWARLLEPCESWSIGTGSIALRNSDSSTSTHGLHGATCATAWPKSIRTLANCAMQPCWLPSTPPAH